VRSFNRQNTVCNKYEKYEEKRKKNAKQLLAVADKDNEVDVADANTRHLLTCPKFDSAPIRRYDFDYITLEQIS